MADCYLADEGAIGPHVADAFRVKAVIRYANVDVFDLARLVYQVTDAFGSEDDAENDEQARKATQRERKGQEGHQKKNNERSRGLLGGKQGDRHYAQPLDLRF